MLRHQLAELRRMVFGQRRERFIPEKDPSQTVLFEEGEGQTDAPESTAEDQEEAPKKKRKKKRAHPGRNRLPSHLPVVDKIIEPELEGKREDWEKIGQEVLETLDYQPSKLLVRRYIRPRYVRKNSLGEGEIRLAPMPVRPIPKAMAEPGLLAQMALEKFCDHLPEYRQLQRYKREGVLIADSTYNQWMASIGVLLTSLHEQVLAELLTEKYLQADETTIKVLDPDLSGKTHRGYYWALNSPKSKIVYFQYAKSRNGKVIRDLLQTENGEWRGHLQTDGYEVYKNKKLKTKPAFCWAHARRYFKQALDNDKNRASHVLKKIQKLYNTEQKAREQELPPPERAKLRQEEAVPILEDLEKTLKEYYLETHPKTAIRKAVDYALKHWHGLRAYAQSETGGILEIDNNAIENAIRPVALGRKNYLFAGSHKGADRAAAFYSLFAICKKHGVNPYAWLKYVLEQYDPDAKYNAKEMKELLPHHWAKNKAEAQ